MSYQQKLFDTYSNTLEDLYRKVATCKKCPYHLINEGRVNASGNNRATIIVVGQGPGKSEVETGRPFTGSSGKALRKVMESVGINKSSVYLTNLIRCAQPEGKSIIAKAIRMCGGWLDDTVGIIKPKIIVSLGGMAAKVLANIESINESGGNIVDSKYGIPTIATWHTAYALRMKKIDIKEYNRIAHEIVDHWRAVKSYVETH